MANKVDVSFEEYLSCRQRERRLAILQAYRGAGRRLPLSLAADLLELDLGLPEQKALLELADSDHDLVYEHFLTRHLLGWSQELAASALRLWAERTDHFLWFRLLALGRSTIVPQRVRYTILDIAWCAGGRILLDSMPNLDGLEEFSPAFHGLLLHRALQWNLKHDRLIALARHAALEVSRQLHPEAKALPSALAYLLRYEPKAVEEIAATATITETWRDHLRTLLQHRVEAGRQLEKLEKLVAKPSKDVGRKLWALWPAAWLREDLSGATIAAALTQAVNDPTISARWESFGGIETQTLVEALEQMAEPEAFGKALRLLGGLLPYAGEDSMRTRIIERVNALGANANDPQAYLETLPPVWRPTPKALTGVHAAFDEERRAILAGNGVVPLTEPFDWQTEGTPEDVARKRFFDLAYRKRGGVAPEGEGFWELLAQGWTSPDGKKLDALAKVARQQEGVFRLAYIDTLGRFAGHDEAALKLLDFIRSSEEDELRAVIRALGGIGTARALQELVSALTRPNVTQALQMEICAILKAADVSGLQKEIRAALNDVPVDINVEDGRFELREALASLLDPQGEAEATDDAALQTVATDQDLDRILSGKIRHFKSLSSEVKRALRTAQFFHIQVSAGGAPESIDLSPVIDMQYKALELLFRETFEEHCSRLIHQGVLQRKLDVLGYARPVPSAMDEFENYVGSLPIIRDIPFFSKFKMRKMLRAICQFRPGRRFTLDGLKAFAIFFLCFGRKECRHGLTGLMDLGFADDKELFEFCKALHVLQDARNRAAHEGFHPDASNDIDGIWRATAEIIQTAFFVKERLDQAMAKAAAPKNRSQPIIEKKVS